MSSFRSSVSATFTSFIVALGLSACGGDDTMLDVGASDSAMDAPLDSTPGDVGRDTTDDVDLDAPIDVAPADTGPPPVVCEPPDRVAVRGDVGGTRYEYDRASSATLVGDHIRVQSDDLAIGTRRWIVTVPNRPGTYECGDTAQIQVALVGVPGIAGDGGAAAATEALGSCKITVNQAAAADGDDVAGCFVATLSADVGGSEMLHEVLDGRFRGRRMR